MIPIVLLALALATPPAPPPVAAAAAAAPAAEELFQQALEAEKAGDWPRYRELVERTVAALPDASRLYYRLAGARLLAGDRTGALDALRRQVDAGVDRDPRADPRFAPLADDPAFRAEVERMLRLREPLARATEAFRLDRGDLIEGIAHDEKTGATFLSSVRERRIVRRDRDGALSEFVAAGAHGLASALGLAVDAPRRRLWVVSAGLPHAAGLAPAERDRSALLAFDLDRGALLRRVEAPAGALWNDLELAPDGTVYASDPARKAIDRVAPDGAVTPLASGQGLRSPGGLALSADGTRLYVADWTQGLAVVDVASGRLEWMQAPPGATTLGIDGLRRQGDALVAIQNGVQPARIQRFALAGGGRALAGGEMLERARPDWDEPTLGTLVGGELWYVANSHWPKFDETGALAAGVPLEPTVVLRLPLGPTR